jgi:hypothetical protein
LTLYGSHRPRSPVAVRSMVLRTSYRTGAEVSESELSRFAQIPHVRWSMVDGRWSMYISVRSTPYPYSVQYWQRGRGSQLGPGEVFGIFRPVNLEPDRDTEYGVLYLYLYLRYLQYGTLQSVQSERFWRLNWAIHTPVQLLHIPPTFANIRTSSSPSPSMQMLPCLDQ